MKNKITEADMKNFMELVRPTKAVGFFSEGYSGDKDNFVEGLEGSMSGLYTGYMVILDKSRVESIYDSLTTYMENTQVEYMDEDVEMMTLMFNLSSGKVLLMTAEFGSCNDLAELVAEWVKGSGVSFDEATLTPQDMEDAGIEISQEYKLALIELAK